MAAAFFFELAAGSALRFLASVSFLGAALALFFSAAANNTNSSSDFQMTALPFSEAALCQASTPELSPPADMLCGSASSPLPCARNGGLHDRLFWRRLRDRPWRSTAQHLYYGYMVKSCMTYLFWRRPSCRPPSGPPWPLQSWAHSSWAQPSWQRASWPWASPPLPPLPACSGNIPSQIWR